MPGEKDPKPLCLSNRQICVADGTAVKQPSPRPHTIGASNGLRALPTPTAATYAQPEEATESVAISLGAEMSWDSVVRDVYNKGAAAIRAQAQELVRTGQMTPEEAKVWSNGQRNALMQACRDKSSPLGKAIAEAIKKEGKSVADLEKLGKSAQGIIESAGKTNPMVNRVAVGFRYAGPALLVVGLSFSAYHIATAPESERWSVVAGEAGVWAGALAGGYVGGLGGAKAGGVVGTFIEPGGGTAVGGVVGGFIGSVGGAIVGGWAGSTFGNYVYHAVQ